MEESTELDIGRYLRMIYKKRVLFVLIAGVVLLGLAALFMLPGTASAPPAFERISAGAKAATTSCSS